MISFSEAHNIVLGNTANFGNERVPLDESHNRVLDEKIVADRDFPPFDRVTKDGIAISFKAYLKGTKKFEVQETAAAGSPQTKLRNESSCIEVMTGAVLPIGTDTVIMYEHLEIKDAYATVQKEVKRHQNVHGKGGDVSEGSLLLNPSKLITAATIGVLASVGKSQVLVKKVPKIGIVSTGNELVNIEEIPEPHQIRKSNSVTLGSALKLEGLDCKYLHFNDLQEEIKVGLDKALSEYDVLLLSGGVSKGKFDYLPQAFEDLGVHCFFHRVRQRPGKPFWFGKHERLNCTIFAFPGNPASTFANYHVYFLPWLYKSLGLSIPNYQVILQEPFENNTDLTRFIRAKVNLIDGKICANLVMGNGSGDLTSLSKSNGFILFEPLKGYEKGEVVQFYPTMRIV